VIVANTFAGSMGRIPMRLKLALVCLVACGGAECKPVNERLKTAFLRIQ
jgi:hypothetical protein